MLLIDEIMFMIKDTLIQHHHWTCHPGVFPPTQTKIFTIQSSPSPVDLFSYFRDRDNHYLCGIYTTMKKIVQIGPCSLTHAIIVLTWSELCIFVLILGEIMMTSPAARSAHFPCSFFSISADVIHKLESSIIFCLSRNSANPRTSLPNDLQNSCLVLR